MLTLGSKTFQYQEEKKQTCIPSVAASESAEAQTHAAMYGGCKAETLYLYKESKKIIC